ncbi:DUF2637 domain-containing protein [Streptomyces sp. NPDC002766]|uniref:DUF2637 domain-containing protein n=1 Tax=Streptomyces sp. NPDC002766 TaxID=3154429 RepID=UPI00331C4D4C
MHKVLIGAVATGAVIIAGIGFAGSYAAVRRLALKQGFGDFSYAFPIGVDAGIVVLLALDLLLTWIRIPFPLLRQAAWLLTAATIAFNGAAAWPDPLGVGMHAVIPVLFVVAVEAARHAVGRIADITADKHMEGVRLTRWLLSPGPTFLLWRRMKLWELRSYEQVIKLEQERLVYQARLHQRFGRAWRRKAPVEALMPLRLARYGVPLRETAPAGLAAAGITLPTADLERLDGDNVREELPGTSSTPELEPVQADVDSTEHHGQDEGVDTAAAAGAVGHPEPEPYDAYEPELEGDYRGGYDPYSVDHSAGAPVSVAARGEGRPRRVQARIDVPEWGVDSLADEALGQSPMGDGQGGVFVPGQAAEPVLPESAYEGYGPDEVEPTPETEPEGLTGIDLLEWRYVRLSPEQRALSAVKLGELLHEGTGFTAGTARKYLGEIIRKHR